MTTTDRIVVVGAGIGGLTAGLCLQEAGFDVQLVEQFDAVHEVGAGILLAPNASAVLYNRLSLGDELDAVSAPMTQAALKSWRGKTLYERSVGAEDYSGPARMIHRAALQRVLYDALGADQVLLSSPVKGFEFADDQVAAIVEDDRHISGDALVGADGVHSKIREQLVGDKADPLRYHGYTCWRGITVPFEHRDFKFGSLHEIQGRGLRAGMGYVDEERVYWWATADTPEGESDDPATINDDLGARYADFPDYFRAMLDATPPDQILRNDIHDRRPLKQWGIKAVTLLGDAAHPMAPNLGQGACSAIVDADMLAICLGEAQSLEEGLRKYEELRRPRTTWLQGQSKRFGDVGQWKNSVAVRLREWSTALMPGGSIEKLWDKIWNYDSRRIAKG